MLQRGPLADLGHEPVEARHDHCHGGAGVVELELQLFLRIKRIGGDDHGAGAQRPVVGDDHLGHVGHEEGNSLALLHPQASQRCGEARCLGIHLPVSEAAGVTAGREEDQGFAFWVVGGGVGEKSVQGDLWVGQGGWNASLVVSVPGPWTEAGPGGICPGNLCSHVDLLLA